MNGASCNVSVKERYVFSKPTRLAKVTVGIPMLPNGVGTPFAIKQTKQENKAGNPNPTSIPAGIAIAVPKPAIPSMNPPKHQATNRTRSRLSLVTEVIICLINSIAPVLTVKLYVKTAATITTTIGQRAIKKPSRAAVLVSMTGSFQTNKASKKATIIEPHAAFQVGHFSSVKATINHKIGHKPRTKSNPIICFLLSFSRFIITESISSHTDNSFQNSLLKAVG